MVTLSESQWQAVQEQEEQHYIDAVCEQFLKQRPEMQQAPGREQVRARMQKAYDFAKELGMNSAAHRVQLMYLAADAPGLCEDAQFKRYLGKAGATPEQRLEEVMAVVKHKLKEVN